MNSQYSVILRAPLLWIIVS